MNRCYGSAVCDPDQSDRDDYICRCNEYTIDGVTLIPKQDAVQPSSLRERNECTYTLPGWDSDDVKANIFTYDGKPTIYAYRSDERYLYRDYSFKKAVCQVFKTIFTTYWLKESLLTNITHSIDLKTLSRKCSELGMHLPVPNTQQQYEDLKQIPMHYPGNKFWLGYTATDGAWLNIYNDDELIIDIPTNTTDGTNLVMSQYGQFTWDAVGSSSWWGRATLCIKPRIFKSLDH